jgi:hypothetical protein
MAPGKDTSVTVLEPGRKRRHPMPLLARLVWGIAIAVAIAVGLLLR